MAESIPGSCSTAAQRAEAGAEGGISPAVTSPMKRSPPGLALNAENAWVGVLKNRSPTARDIALSVAMALPTTPDPKRPELSPLSSALPPPAPAASKAPPAATLPEEHRARRLAREPEPTDHQDH